tara:strand:+ start:781 stop:1389 length:609 start_codon:yes stop_codon:yes gene_type:complete
MPLISMAQLQQTYVPDDNFEAALEYMGIGNGIPNDDYVDTYNISDIFSLYISFQDISDLTGIEDFLSLRSLHVEGNQLTNIDLSNNTDLKILYVVDNQLTQLDISNNPLIELLHVFNNPGLECINVYDITQANNWPTTHALLDNNQYFSESCVLTDVAETYQYRKVVKIIDLWGRDVITSNQPVFFIYDDGSVERKIIINNN